MNLAVDATKVLNIPIDNFDIARLRMHEFLSWEPYKPQVDSETDLQMLVPEHKHDLDRAQLLMNLGMPVIKPVIPALLEWVQDINWPVAQKLAPYLAGIVEQVEDEILEVFNSDDAAWKYFIMNHILTPARQLSTRLKKALETIENKNAEDQEWQLAETAGEVLAHHA